MIDCKPNLCRITMKKLVTLMTGLIFSHMAFAIAPIGVQVTNLETGGPATQMNVELEAQQNNTWTKIGEGTTDDKGRLDTLYPSTKTTLDKGIYKITFKTGDWFKNKNLRAFYAEIPIVFVIDGSTDHYQIPLTISQYGYSTYKSAD